MLYKFALILICGSSASTPFTPMVSTFRKGMTNFPPLFFPHRNYLHLFYIYFYILSTFVLFVSLFVSFVLQPLSDSLLFIFISSSLNSWYLHSLFNLLCVVTGPEPDSAFCIFFFCVHFTPDQLPLLQCVYVCSLFVSVSLCL